MSDFRLRAACRGVDPELFFPVGTSGPAQAQALAAKAVCRHCAVRLECLSQALSTHQKDGVWGGLDPVERHQLHRESVVASPDSVPFR